MAAITQANRSLALTTPLGPDALLLLGFAGTESLSRLFSYELDLASENDSIAAKDIVGKPVTWSISRLDQKPRYFSGIVSRFVAGALSRRNLRMYRAEVVPWPWLLTRTTDCRIFQNLSTPDIITKIFGDFGFSDFKLELMGSYPKREYCVQYRETAFNFISRLMEHEGIFYFFRHEDGKHTLVLADSASSYADCPESQVEYSPGSLAANHVFSWEHHYEFCSGKWTRTDYNFETPSTNLLTTTRTVIDLPDAPKYEIFDYPGEYVVKGVGDPVTKVRMEEEEAGYDVVNAASQCCTFTPCGKFTLQRHEIDAENGDYMITSIRHAATEASYGSTSNGATYKNSFTCIPASVIFRAPRATSKPMVQGVQTAVVTGPPGEKIYVDKYGRVKVQFFWDRRGKKDADSSCWIRVSNNWGGAGWGGMNLPHVGQEVIVDFEEGDPDRPIITGRVYNAECMPPLELPKHKTRSAIRDHGGNEIVMEGDGGKQQMRLFSPTHKTTMTLGSSFIFDTLSDWVQRITGNRETVINGSSSTRINGDTTERFHGIKDEVIYGIHSEVKMGMHSELVLGVKHETHAGIKFEQDQTLHVKQFPNYVEKAAFKVTKLAPTVLEKSDEQTKLIESAHETIKGLNRKIENVYDRLVTVDKKVDTLTAKIGDLDLKIDKKFTTVAGEIDLKSKADISIEASGDIKMNYTNITFKGSKADFSGYLVVME